MTARRMSPDELVRTIHQFRRRHRRPPELVLVHPSEADRFVGLLAATDYHDLRVDGDWHVPPGTLVLAAEDEDEEEEVLA